MWDSSTFFYHKYVYRISNANVVNKVGKTSNLPKKQKLLQRKLAGAATYRSTNKKEWEKKYPISPGQALYEFWCKVCLRNIGCSHQGEADVK